MENHFLQMENKKSLSITEVVSVEGFDDENIFINLKGEALEVSGSNLHIEALDLEEGRLTCSGEIRALVYTKQKEKRERKTVKDILTGRSGR